MALLILLLPIDKVNNVFPCIRKYFDNIFLLLLLFFILLLRGIVNVVANRRTFKFGSKNFQDIILICINTI